MSSPRHFEIVYRLTNSTRPPQKTVIQASDAGAAKQIFAQQNPGCAISSAPKEIRR